MGSLDVDRFRELRMRRGLSQADVARQLGVSRSVIANMERPAPQRTTPKPVTYQKVCALMESWLSEDMGAVVRELQTSAPGEVTSRLLVADILCMSCSRFTPSAGGKARYCMHCGESVNATDLLPKNN